MQFETIADFINMGGHGVYVWASFGVSILVLSLNVMQPWLAQKKIRVSLQKKFLRESKIK